MSESVARDMRDQRPAIDLEEFERRLRAPDPQRRGEDPLVELARLVGSANDPFRNMFTGVPKPAAMAQQGMAQQGMAQQGMAQQGMAQQEQDYAVPAVAPPQYPQHYQGELNPELAPHVLREVAGQMRLPASGYLPPAPPDYQDAPGGHVPGAMTPQGAWQDYESAQVHQESALAAAAGREQWIEQAPDGPEMPAAARPRADFPPPPAGLEASSGERKALSRKSLLYMGSAVAVVVVGVGVTLATGGKMKSAGVPTIAASRDPVKLKPEGEDVSAPRVVRTVAVAGKPGDMKPQQSNAVNREEQPVDLSQVQVQPRGGARFPDSDLNKIVNLNSRDAGKPVASVAPQGTSAPQSGGYFPEPRRVRTVSVKPDGSVVPDAQPVQAAPRAPSIPSLAAGTPNPRPSVTSLPIAPAAARPQAATPATGEKATVRANRPPTVQEIARNGGAEPEVTPAATPRAARPAPAPKPAPQRQAAVAPAPRATPAPAAAAAAAPAASASGGGGFAIQLAAPPTAAEAESTAARLRQRFGPELGGRAPTIRQAVVGDKTVYRVRVGGLSREDATAMCSKLQGKGGACFVARN